MQKYFGSKTFNLDLLKLAIPIVIQSFINSSLNFIDNLMVGQLGTAIIGGVATSNRFFAIMNSGTSSIVGTCGIFIGQFFGASNVPKIKESFRIAVWSSYLLMLPFLIMSLFFPSAIMNFFISDPEIIAVGTQYMRLMSISYLPLCISSSIGCAMKSIGEPKIMIKISGICVTVKIVLNFILMFGFLGIPAMGYVGAAISTLITRFLEAILYLVAIKINHFSFTTKITELNIISLSLLKRIIFKAIPFYINDLLWSSSNSVILKCFGSRGDANYNAYAIASTVMDVFYTIAGGLGTSFTVLVSHKLGNGDLNEARDSAYKTKGFGFIAALLLCSLMFNTIWLIPMLYRGVDTHVILVSQRMITLLSFSYLFYQLSMWNYFIFKAGGEIKSIIIMDCASVWLILVPSLVYVAYYTNLNIYMLICVCIISEYLKMNISNFLFKKEYWIKILS